MVRTVRLQLSRRKGFDLQALSRETNGLEAVNVARPSKWGNIYKVGSWVRDDPAKLPFKVETAAAAVALFREWTTPNASVIQEHLAGKNLGCWCKPGAPCHADVLLELATPTGTNRNG